MNYPLFFNGYFSTLNPLSRWFAFGKIPENPVVTPSSSVQVIRPSAQNRYLESVTVEAVTSPTTTP
jgi:hypothetical protein